MPGRPGPDGRRGAVRVGLQHDGKPGARNTTWPAWCANAPAARFRASCRRTPTPRAMGRTSSSPAMATPSSIASCWRSGRSDLAHDPQLERNDGRARRATEIDSAIQRWCDTHTIEQALATLRAADVPVGKIWCGRYVHRSAVPRTRHDRAASLPRWSPVKLPAVVPPKLSETPAARAGWAALREHTEEVLRVAGV